MNESRSINLSIEVPGTPEEVWDTIATGPGIGSWFIPMHVEGRSGGEVKMDFGDYGEESATVTAWEPPRRVVFQGGGERPLAYEWLVEARDGGTCVVRLVNSGFGTGEEWDGDYDGMTSGWKIFLENLRLQLTYFRGRRARAVIPTAMVPGPRPAAWSTLCSALGIPADLSAGDRLGSGGAGVPVVSGTVEAVSKGVKASAYMLLLDEPGPGTAFIAAEGDGDKVACSVYLYLYDREVESIGGQWSSWFASRFEPVHVLEADPTT